MRSLIEHTNLLQDKYKKFQESTKSTITVNEYIKLTDDYLNDTLEDLKQFSKEVEKALARHRKIANPLLRNEQKIQQITENQRSTDAHKASKRKII